MKSRVHLIFWCFVVWSLAGFGYQLHDAFIRQGGAVLWDLAVYQSAVTAYLDGSPVYEVGHPDLNFVYAPLVLWVFSGLGALLTPVFLVVYASILLAYLGLSNRTSRLALLFYFGVFAFISEPMIRSIKTGNITFPALMLIYLLWQRAKGVADIWLLVTIGALACIKPSFAAFFALWVFRDGFNKKSITRPFIAFIATAAIWAGQAILDPESFRGFLSSLDRQIGLQTGHPDLGKGIPAQLYFLKANRTLALLAHFGFWAFAAAFWQFCLRPWLKANSGSANAAQILCLGAFALCLIATPRLKIYDLAALYLLAVEAVLIFGYCLQNQSRQLAPLIALTATTVGTRVLLDLLSAPDAAIDAFYAILPLWLLIGLGLAAAGTAYLQRPKHGNFGV